MTDFNFNIDILRGQIASELAANSEQAVWVLAEFAARCCEDELAHYADNIGHDPEDVADFFRRFADMIETGGSDQ